MRTTVASLVLASGWRSCAGRCVVANQLLKDAPIKYDGGIDYRPAPPGYIDLARRAVRKINNHRRPTSWVERTLDRLDEELDNGKG